jgi:hypothetical protein
MPKRPLLVLATMRLRSELLLSSFRLTPMTMPTALSLFDRALALSNSNIFALSCSAIVLAWMGNTKLASSEQTSPFGSVLSIHSMTGPIVHLRPHSFTRSHCVAKVESCRAKIFSRKHKTVSSHRFAEPESSYCSRL